MFRHATAFNQDLSEWDVSNVTNMNNMFNSAAAFNQDLSRWVVINVRKMEGMFNGVPLSIANYDALLGGWSARTLQRGVDFGVGGSNYCNVSARNILVNTYNWRITDAEKTQMRIA